MNPASKRATSRDDGVQTVAALFPAPAAARHGERGSIPHRDPPGYPGLPPKPPALPGKTPVFYFRRATPPRGSWAKPPPKRNLPAGPHAVIILFPGWGGLFLSDPGRGRRREKGRWGGPKKRAFLAPWGMGPRGPSSSYWRWRPKPRAPRNPVGGQKAPKFTPSVPEILGIHRGKRAICPLPKRLASQKWDEGGHHPGF